MFTTTTCIAAVAGAVGTSPLAFGGLAVGAAAAGLGAAAFVAATGGAGLALLPLICLF